MLGIETRAAGWEASVLPLCHVFRLFYWKNFLYEPIQRQRRLPDFSDSIYFWRCILIFSTRRNICLLLAFTGVGACVRVWVGVCGERKCNRVSVRVSLFVCVCVCVCVEVERKWCARWERKCRRWLERKKVENLCIGMRGKMSSHLFKMGLFVIRAETERDGDINN